MNFQVSLRISHLLFLEALRPMCERACALSPLVRALIRVRARLDGE